MQARTPAGVLRQLQTIDACPGRTISTRMAAEQSKDGPRERDNGMRQSKKIAHVQGVTRC
jgi:hypothetical protein